MKKMRKKTKWTPQYYTVVVRYQISCGTAGGVSWIKMPMEMDDEQWQQAEKDLTSSEIE